MKLQPKPPREALHPTSLGWNANGDRSESTYNPLPFAVRMAMAADSRPPEKLKILTAEETKASLSKFQLQYAGQVTPTKDLLETNLRVIREAKQSTHSEVAKKETR
jgi:hypothetical protein